MNEKWKEHGKTLKMKIPRESSKIDRIRKS